MYDLTILKREKTDLGCHQVADKGTALQSEEAGACKIVDSG